MKKIILFLSIITIFSACTSSDTVTLDGNTRSYKTANFEIRYPLDWEVIETVRYERNLPENIVVGFRSNIKNELFTTNITIAVDVFEQTITPRTFALSTLSLAKSRLVNFSEIMINEQFVETSGEEKVQGFIIEYEGRSSPKDPIIRFKQLFVNKGIAMYTITKAHVPNEDESIVNMAELMLRSFSLN